LERESFIVVACAVRLPISVPNCRCAKGRVDRNGRAGANSCPPLLRLDDHRHSFCSSAPPQHRPRWWRLCRLASGLPARKAFMIDRCGFRKMGMARLLSLDRAQSHDWDQPLGSALVVLVRGINLYQTWPELGLFFFPHSLRREREASAPDRQLDRRVGLKVQIPAWVLRPATLGCDNNEVLPIGEIQERHCSSPTGFAALGCQQADRRARGEAAQPFATAQAIDQDIERARNAHGSFVHSGAFTVFRLIPPSSSAHPLKLPWRSSAAVGSG
jgi:hypothetical protein